MRNKNMITREMIENRFKTSKKRYRKDLSIIQKRI